MRYLWCSNELRALENVISGPPFVKEERVPTPNLPPGFDFTDPDIYAERLPIEELAEMRKVAPI